jgi:SAM-dependent methyltransferase
MGYHLYKQRSIVRALDTDTLSLAELPANYGSRLDERVVEYPWVFSRLTPGPGTLLDAGSSLNHEYLLRREPLASKTIFISTLAPEREAHWTRSISYIFEDLRSMCFRDGQFDFVVCISTLEHVGMDNTMLYTDDSSKQESDIFAYQTVVQEIRRVLKDGGTLYLSVPYGRYKNHGWFQIFDSEMLDTVISAFQPSSLDESHFRYRDNGWHASSRDGSSDATAFDPHAGVPFAADYAAHSRAIACLEMVK